MEQRIYIYTLSHWTKDGYKFRYLCPRCCFRRQGEAYWPCEDAVACRCEQCGIWANGTRA